MPLTKINFSTAVAETIGNLPDSSKVTNVDNDTRFLVVEDEETKYTTLSDITSGVLAEGNITSDVTSLRGDITNLQLGLGNANSGIIDLGSQISTINGELVAINGDITDINANVTTIKSTATSHAGTFASTTAAGHVFLGTDTQISDNSAPVGFNSSNKLSVENASSTAYGVVKLTSDSTISTENFNNNIYGHIYKTPDGKIALPIATTNVFGVIKKSSATGTSIPCIGVTDGGQAVLNVRSSHSGFEKDGNTIYIQTSTNEHPTNGAEITAPVATDTAGKLAVPPATTAKAGGVLLATTETDARINAVPTIAQFKALLDRVAALENALASVTLVTAPETTA